MMTRSMKVGVWCVMVIIVMAVNLEAFADQKVVFDEVDVSLVDHMDELYEVLLVDRSDVSAHESPRVIHELSNLGNGPHNAKVCMDIGLILGGSVGMIQLGETFVLLIMMSFRNFKRLAPTSTGVIMELARSALTAAQWAVLVGGGCYVVAASYEQIQGDP